LYSVDARGELPRKWRLLRAELYLQRRPKEMLLVFFSIFHNTLHITYKTIDNFYVSFPISWNNVQTKHYSNITKKQKKKQQTQESWFLNRQLFIRKLMEQKKIFMKTGNSCIDLTVYYKCSLHCLSCLRLAMCSTCLKVGQFSKK
jgi:hypothetical protein